MSENTQMASRASARRLPAGRQRSSLWMPCVRQAPANSDGTGRMR